MCNVYTSNSPKFILFRATKLKYYVGGKTQKAKQNTINSDSGLSLKCIPVMIIVGLTGLMIWNETTHAKSTNSFHAACSRWRTTSMQKGTE